MVGGQGRGGGVAGGVYTMFFLPFCVLTNFSFSFFPNFKFILILIDFFFQAKSTRQARYAQIQAKRKAAWEEEENNRALTEDQDSALDGYAASKKKTNRNCNYLFFVLFSF